MAERLDTLELDGFDDLNIHVSLSTHAPATTKVAIAHCDCPELHATLGRKVNQYMTRAEFKPTKVDGDYCAYCGHHVFWRRLLGFGLTHDASATTASRWPPIGCEAKVVAYARSGQRRAA